MANFGSYFGLCPLIDHRSLLGISKDLKNGRVLVTLGRNIAMQYRLADQKQILSWTTKEKFTSPVIFDFEINKYVAVFNQMFIRCWDHKDLSLDKVKKLKFKTNIHTLIEVENASFLIFQNGTIINLKEAISSHKTLDPEGILEEKEYIVDIISCASKAEKYIGLLIGNSDLAETSHLLWTVFDSQGIKVESSRLKLKRNDVELVGSTFHLLDQQVELFTLWSDGKLYVQSVESNVDGPGEMFSIIESISCKELVSMVSLDRDYIAIYGGNSNQEGALLIIYNMQFKITQCRQPFKLLTVGAKLWQIQEKLILPVGQNLAVVPYHLEKEQLSALVGSHRVNQNQEARDVVIVQNLEEVLWLKEKDDHCNKKEGKLKRIAKQYLQQGYPESIIFQEIVPEYIESNNVKSLEFLLTAFDDIPEKYFAELLLYFLEVPDDIFDNSEPHSSDLYPENLQPYERFKILSLILKKPINDVCLSPFLRAKLNLDNVMKLLSFISFLFVDDSNIPDVKFMNALIEWICLLMDANYQTFLLSKDENVLKILLTLTELVNNELSCLEDLQKLLSVTKQLCKKKKITKFVESNYTVEIIDFQ